MKLVVDASIVVPYFVPERFSEAAHRWIGSAQRLLAPDFLILEVGNVLWKKVRHGEITHGQAERILARMMDGRIALRPSSRLARAAWRLAAELDHPIYDCSYLALAIAEDALLVTSDDRFRRRAGKHALGARVRWAGDSPAA